MQTETPLYVSDVLGEIDNSASTTVEPEFQGAGQHRPGLALRIADRRESIRKGNDRGDYVAWLALAVLAALILVALVKFDVGNKIGKAIGYELCKITNTQGDGKQGQTDKKDNCAAPDFSK